MEVVMVRRLAVMLSLIFLFSGMALAAEFSADTITTGKGHTNTGKAFFSKDKYRIDMEVPQKGSGKALSSMSMITRIDKKVIWTIMPDRKMYMEKAYDDMKDRPMVEQKMAGEVERKEVGAETIDGHPTKKYLVTRKSGIGQHQVYSWWATDMNFPIKTAAVDGSWSQEYKNIKIGAQPDSLFEVPAGYTKFQMPGQ
jgi:hypothetical protein